MSAANFGTYTRAIVRQIPDSIRDSSEAFRDRDRKSVDYGLPMYEPIDLEKARREHEVYTQTLRDLGLEVTVVPPDESTPDCPFVEDTCIVVGNKALLTRPAGKTRRKEIDTIERVLTDLGLEVHRMRDEKAMLEGGDVVFTGQEFFVGNSVCSNRAGQAILAETFPEYPVHSIRLDYPKFHLKGVICMAAPGVIAVGESKWGKHAWKSVQNQAKFTYEPLWLPDKVFADHTCDVIHFNGNLVHCKKEEGAESVKRFAARFPDLNRVELTIGELEKVDAGLTCCSVLL
ncbi:N(G),N(G)-dimethylarginine dimethylaminohydrolase 1 [Branchiostoma belcheri]|nr:N(G),N(G)-dimethylarginine dimethylaminohydrolase 1 [Branchiostoma belcheri]